MAEQFSSEMNTLSLSETMAEQQVSSEMNTLSLSETMISLITSDNVVFKVKPSIAKEMGTVQTFVDESDGKITTVPLHNVSSSELPLIIKYCEKNVAGEINKAFEAEFVKNLDNEEVKDLFLAANYLDTKKLLDFTSQVIADRIENKSVEYVRKYFGIEDTEFLPGEEEKLREELAWSFTGVDKDEDEDEDADGKIDGDKVEDKIE
ncbi:putative S-phase kinase-associated protein [Medicago truncatula]|uniref:Putative S-phase kinase-associated protein n=1 Tax=Medicago truncatula TaxID=3880 RepID=G7IQV4_MEDTR|nr:SKP1-like protein 14 [Medicago truncatula]AES66313.1 SCF ubiquitin ligase, SKP1 component [Medicago truncatula]RHN74444.1 putative S-phase kinase-associated protein [Medicago truncatula]